VGGGMTLVSKILFNETLALYLHSKIHMSLAKAIQKKSLWCSQSGNHSLEGLAKYFSTRYI
jgi:hypothetical protein